MRLLPLALLPLALAAGCAPKGYLFDHSEKSKTALIVPELVRYGFGAEQSQCIGGKLGVDLSIWQLRQLLAAGVALRGPNPGSRAAGDLLRAASQVRDREVPVAVPRAVADCGAAAVTTAVVNAPVATPIAAPAASAPAAAVPEAATAPLPSGPPDYQPSEEFVQATEAFERGDTAAAARLTRSAADKGDSGAQQFLGGLYAFGAGVPKDPAAAARWYAMAAEQGWAEAMNNLGQAYERGEGVPRNPVEALKWYILASARDTEDVAMVRRNMASLTLRMSEEQIAEASALAQAWEQRRR